MLSGRFLNCYGIKEFTLPGIDFTRCNKAIIYAPNGVMKTSFSKVFEDIAHGKASTDRIFRNATTSYAITYYASQYNYSSASPQNLPTATDKIYVVNSFADKFEFTKETVGTLLADETTRNEYNVLIEEFSGEVRQIEENLRGLTGLTKPKIKEALMSDLSLPAMADWPDIFEKLSELMPQYTEQAFFNDTNYSELFNDKALAIYQKPDFKQSIAAYVESFGALLANSPLLSGHFTDRSAEALSKAFLGNNLFEAQHKIQLRDGTTVNSLDEWNRIVEDQLQILYQTPELSEVFTKLKRLLTANNEGSRVRDILVAHREIIPFLQDIPSLKIQAWLNCLTRLDRPFEDYYMRISEYTDRIRGLYERASEQSARWQEVVSEFNQRFRVPFEVKINNKANVLLKDEAPNLSFIYSRGSGDSLQTTELGKDDLMVSLSMGEKRALYLLYILFDLERIRRQAVVGAGKFLIIADDIADSFDYKNKYAIIEYLNDLSQNNGIDLLMLTHNFDFYRTVKLRLGVNRPNCFIAQKNADGVISMTVFKYQNDFFKKVIKAKIEDGKIDTDEKKTLLIASIPFYRNLSDYSGKDNDYLKLTCFLHKKTAPLDTNALMLSDLWVIVRSYLNNAAFCGSDEPYCLALQRIATSIVGNATDEVSLENKLLIAIATRLTVEKFLERKLLENGQPCVDSESNQTRDWFKQAESYLTIDERNVVEEVNLITPENIHLNAFMYEPLIDISSWTLRDLYQRASAL
jgi:hypothetical protein